MLLNVKEKHGITGLEAETILDKVNITCNKNGLPFDLEKPKYTSGIRLGTPAITTRGFKEKEMVLIAELIDLALTHRNDEKVLNEIKESVVELTSKYPLFKQGGIEND